MSTRTTQFSPGLPVWNPLEAVIASFSAGGPPLFGIAIAIAVAVVAVAAPYLGQPELSGLQMINK